MVWKLVDYDENKLIIAKADKRRGRYIFELPTELELGILDDAILKDSCAKTIERCRRTVAMLKLKPKGWISPKGDPWMGLLFSWLQELHYNKDSWMRMMAARRDPMPKEKIEGSGWHDLAPNVPFFYPKPLPKIPGLTHLDNASRMNGWTGKMEKPIVSKKQTKAHNPVNSIKPEIPIPVVKPVVTKAKVSLVDSSKWMLVKKGGKVEKKSFTQALPLTKPMQPGNPNILPMPKLAQFSSCPIPLAKCAPIIVPVQLSENINTGKRTYADVLKSPPKIRVDVQEFAPEKEVEKKEIKAFFWKKYWRAKRRSFGAALKGATIVPLSKMFKPMKVNKIEKKEVEAWPVLNCPILQAKERQNSIGAIFSTIVTLPNKRFALSNWPKGKAVPEKEEKSNKEGKKEKNTTPKGPPGDKADEEKKPKKEENENENDKRPPSTPRNLQAKKEEKRIQQRASREMKKILADQVKKYASQTPISLPTMATPSSLEHSRIPLQKQHLKKARKIKQETQETPLTSLITRTSSRIQTRQQTPTSIVTQSSGQFCESASTPEAKPSTKPERERCAKFDCGCYIFHRGVNKEGKLLDCKRHRMHQKCYDDLIKLCPICHPPADEPDARLNRTPSPVCLSGDERSVETSDSESTQTSSRPRQKGRFVKRMPKRKLRRGKDGRFSKKIPIIDLEEIMAEDRNVFYDPDGMHILSQEQPELQLVSEEEEEDAQPEPPVQPRRNPPRNRRSPQRYSPPRPLPKWTDVTITDKCRHHQHKGLGCAAVSAGHTPRYYNSLKPHGDDTVYRCPFCVALLLRSEAKGRNKYSKCCAKGKIDLLMAYYGLLKPFLHPQQRRDEDEEEHDGLDEATQELDTLLYTLISGLHPDSKNFAKFARRYNKEFSCGTISTVSQPVPGDYPPVKINGQVVLNMSGLHPPINPETGERRLHLGGQVWTMDPDDAINLRQGRNADARLHLSDLLLEKLHHLLQHPQIGHPYARAYQRAEELFKQKEQELAAAGQPMDNNRFIVELMTPHEVEQRGVQTPATVHPHQVLMQADKNHLAQVYFIEGDNPVPPTKETGILLTARDGEVKKLPWWDIHTDGALFPLLFPRCDTIWRPKLPQREINENRNQDPIALPPLPAPIMPLPDAELDDYNNDPNVAINPFHDEDDNPHHQLDEMDSQGEGEQLIIEEEHHSKYVSKSQAARYHMQIREPPNNPGDPNRNPWRDPHFIWWSQRLAEEYVCILTNKIERERYAEFKKKQKNLRTALPKAMIDMLQGKIRKLLDPLGRPLEGRGELGRVFIAPETMRGSRKYYQRAFGDATAICREEGTPHLLITYTMDKDAEEFNTMLNPGQLCFMRPDIIARLFRDKLDEFLKDIVQREVMGPVKGWFYSVEHQKRGLPHVHLVVILDFERMNLTHEEYIEEYITAEIPENPRGTDRSTAARLQERYRQMVCKKMYHTCNPRFCLKDRKCSKRFPKPYSDKTVIHHRGVGVNYIRRPPASSIAEWKANKDTLGYPEIGKDNRYVVPHNRFLVCKYGSHINVEWIQGDACIKYVLKYVMKGADLAFVQIVPVNDDGTGRVQVDYDETKEMSLARYQTASEGMLTIYGNKIVRLSHQCDVNYIHLPGQYRMVFHEGEEQLAAENLAAQMQDGEEQQSPLTAYFALNRTLDPDEAQLYTYETINMAFAYNKATKSWQPRQHIRQNHISRLGTVGASNHEAQILRMLLLTVHGPTGWDDLRGDDGTFLSKAIDLGLVESSQIWVKTIVEAFGSIRGFGRRFNWLATLFANNRIHDPMEVLNDVLEDSNEWLRPARMRNSPLRDVLQYVLRRLEFVFRLQNVRHMDDQTCCEALGLQAPEGFAMTDDDILQSVYMAGDFHRRNVADSDDDDDDDNNDIGPPTHSRYAAYYFANYRKLNAGQRFYREEIFRVANERRGNNGRPQSRHIFMLSGDGGTGKTFANNVLIANLKTAGFNVMVTASTGIASELLFEGGTMHNRLHIPLNIDENTEPMLDYETEFAKILRHLDVLIIDEVSAVHKNVLFYVDRLLRSIDTSKRNLDFGGKVIVMCGDWKQLLPIVRDYDRYSALAASVKNTDWFKNNKVVQIHLTEIMRLIPGQDIYAKKLKCWGTGYGTTIDDITQIDEDMVVRSEAELIKFTFGDALDNPMSPANMERLSNSAILTPLNDTALKLDQEIQKKIKGVSKTYLSIDRVVSDNPADELAVNIADRNIENLYGRTPPGLPAHKLDVKVGAIMMIVRNISIPEGLCNGTRIQIVGLGDDVIHCRYIYGPRAGKTFELSRYRFRFGGEDDPDPDRYGGVRWERLQFPLRPGFVLTTNKSQGQTLERVGLHLGESQCFSHGQFYVAVSRVKSGLNIRVYTRSTNRLVKNIVVKEIVDQQDIDIAKEYAKDLARNLPTPPPTAGTVPIQDIPTPTVDRRPPPNALTPQPSPPQRPYQCPLRGEMRRRCRDWRTRQYQHEGNDIIYENAVPSGDCFFWASMLADRGIVERPGHPHYNLWPEETFHEILWNAQSALRAWVAENQWNDYNNNVMNYNEKQGRYYAARDWGFASFKAYCDKMKHDADMHVQAYADIVMEGPYVARFYGRPLAAYNQNGTVYVCFPDTLKYLIVPNVPHPRNIRNITYHQNEDGEFIPGGNLQLDNPIVIRFIGNNHFHAVYFRTTEERIRPPPLTATRSLNLPEFSVPSPAIRTPTNASHVTFEDAFGQLSVTPKSMPHSGWTATPGGQQDQQTPPPETRESPLAKKQRRQQQTQSPLAQQQRPHDPNQTQPSTTARRQIIAQRDESTTPISQPIEPFSFFTPSPQSRTGEEVPPSRTKKSSIKKIFGNLVKRIDPTRHRETPPPRPPRWERPIVPQKGFSFYPSSTESTPTKKQTDSRSFEEERRRKKEEELREFRQQLHQESTNMEQQIWEAGELQRQRRMAEEQLSIQKQQSEEQQRRENAELQRQRRLAEQQMLRQQQDEEQQRQQNIRIIQEEEPEREREQQQILPSTSFLPPNLLRYPDRRVAIDEDEEDEEIEQEEEQMDEHQDEEQLVEEQEIEVEEPEINEEEMQIAIKKGADEPPIGFPENELRRNLPRTRPSDEEKNEDCAICSIILNDGRSLCKLQCTHIFHRECIGRWLKDHKSCPNCRGEVLDAAGNMRLPTTPQRPPLPPTTGREAESLAEPTTSHVPLNFQLPRNHFATRHANVWIVDANIVHLHVDAIVNAANHSLLGGSGIDGAIHAAAGQELHDFCARIRPIGGKRCQTGHAVLTPSFNIWNVKSIIHTVGPNIQPAGRQPTDLEKQQLRNCYMRCLDLAQANGITSIAFPCISINIFNFPEMEAAQIATAAIFDWLNTPGHRMDAILICIYNSQRLVSIYQSLIGLPTPPMTQQPPNVPSQTATTTGQQTQQPPPSQSHQRPPQPPNQSFQLPPRHFPTRRQPIVWIVKEDITKLHVEAIVNAANSTLLGGGGVDGAIHKAAGKQLLVECRNLPEIENGIRCRTGDAKITRAYDIRTVRFIIHTVGPRLHKRGDQPTQQQEEQLRSCYLSSLDLARQRGIRSIAFPCISTNIYNFPPDEAAMIAWTAICDWLDWPGNNMEAIFICVFDAGSVQCYQRIAE